FDAGLSFLIHLIGFSEWELFESLELLATACVAPAPAGPCAPTCFTKSDGPAARINTAKPIFFIGTPLAANGLSLVLSRPLRAQWFEWGWWSTPRNGYLAERTGRTTGEHFLWSGRYAILLGPCMTLAISGTT